MPLKKKKSNVFVYRKGRENLASFGLLPKHLKQPGLGQLEVRSSECNPGLTHAGTQAFLLFSVLQPLSLGTRLLEPSPVCLPECASAGRQTWKRSWDEARHSDLECIPRSILITALHCPSSSFPVLLSQGSVFLEKVCDYLCLSLLGLSSSNPTDWELR